MGKKGRFRRAVSALMAALTVMANVFSPLTAYAAEPVEEPKPPLYEEVKDQLDADEVVTAKDYEMEVGYSFDVKIDFSGIEIPDNLKVKVTFEEAKNAAGQDFVNDHADTYKAVYYVEPLTTDHPKYQVSRNLIVNEPATVAKMAAEVQTGADVPEAEDDADDGEAELQAQQNQAVAADMEMAAEPVETYTETAAGLASEALAGIDAAGELPLPASETGNAEGGITENVPAGSSPDAAEAPEGTGTEGTSESDSPQTDTVQETPGEDVETEPEPGAIGEPGTETEAGTVAGAETEPGAETEAGEGTEPAEILEPVTELETEPEMETELESESESESESETEKDGEYEVKITSGEELGVMLDHEDGSYDAGETVVFSTNLPAGSLTAVGALKEESNAQGATADILYSEVTYHADTDVFSFEMPAENIALQVATDYAEGGIMLLASDDTLWDEATEIEANTYYYYSDGQLHPFNSVMGSGGNDSYKYVRYKVDGKTYTVNAYCMQHSMPSPPSGTTYKNMIELDEGGDDKYLRKALFYGYGGPGWGKTFNGYNIKSIMENAGCTSETRAMQHYLVDYLYDGESGFGGALSTTAKNMLKEIKAALKEMPDPGAMTLLPGLSVTANGRDTETFTWKANEAFTLTIQLENGVSLVNETTGKTATGNVTVKGGDKFHLTATTDNISSLKGSYAITSNYPLDFHAMLLKLQNSQDIGFGYYTDSSEITLSVDWPEQAQLDIVKQDAGSGAKLAGAVYGVYSDAACQSLIVQMPPTDANGASSVTFNVTGSTVYLKELTPPKGYKLNINAVGVNVAAGKVTTQTVTDTEILGSLKIYKEGEVLTGAVSGADGTAFQYEKRRLAGAVYQVTAAEAIVAADGRIVFQKGTVVADNVTTGADGMALLENLHMGSYTVTEIGAPKNYVNKGESKTVMVSADGQAEAVFTEVSFQNDRQKAAVTVTKVDDTTKNPLSGGVYGLFAAEDIRNADGKVVVEKDTFIEKAVTGEDGRAVYTADLPIGFGYYVKEMQAPDGYVRNTEDVYAFTFCYTHDTEASVSFSHTFENTRVNAKIYLVKKDAETGETPQGDATLEKAVYGLYAREDIVHPDRKTGVIYQAGTQIATLTTDQNGEASIGDLYLGKYYVKEITPSNGYLLDEQEHDLSCDFEGDLVATVERTATSPEQVIKQPFQLIKVANDGKTDADLLSGVGFTVYLVSSLKVKEDGSYDFASAKPVVIGENGATEIFTDNKGHAVSIAIPFGTYLVRETTTPHNFKPVDDFIVRITENHPTEPQVWRVLLDDEFEAKLKIIKQDDETKKPVLAAGTEFRVFDLTNEKYVEQVTTYPVTVTHTSYFTDSEGYLTLPNNLPTGKYRIEEVNAPEGYTVNGNFVEVSVDSDTMHQIDPVSGDVIIEAVYENHPAKGELCIVKKGEVLSGYGKDFQYEVQPLAGAVFSVTAAEDIYTADYQKDAEGNRICEYREGELVAELTTGEDGKAVFGDLPLGTYRILETKAPEGYVLNGEAQEVTFSYAGQETPVVYQTAEFVNDRQTVKVKALKKDAENEAPLAGAVFGIYAKEEIKAGERILVEADTLLAEATTGSDGCAVFETDLPFADFYVKELQAPAGYVFTAEAYEISAIYQGQDVPVAEFVAEFHNQPTVTEFTKSDITTGTELDGATLTVLDRDKNVVDTWTSVKGEPHIIKRLHVGENYVLREEFAPYGYLKATEVEFTVNKDGSVQKVEMKDEVPTALLIINKDGEFLDKVTLLDSAKGTVEHLFGYVGGSLSEVTFEVYAAEDIRAADGVSEDYYKKDALVGTITTDGSGIAQLGNLPVGKYYVKETETAHGYVLDGEVRYVDLSYRDQDTPVVTYSERWQNARQKAEVHVVKKEKGSDRVLKGGVFGLFAGEDIKSASGEVLLKKDTLIEQRATDENGELTFTADLPVDGSFYVQEVKAPDGFATAKEKQEFVFEYAGADKKDVAYEFVFENEPTIVELTKTDLTDGKELPGAHLRVIEENGDLVEEWVSGKEPHVIKELVAGKTYELIETKPADGYVTAESIQFTVEDTAEIQKHEMKDDVTKVEISKTDLTGSQEVPGARLTILDEDDQVVERWTSGEEPHYVEKLPVGSYTLREERAPEGYVLAEDVAFTVLDTGEIQSVIMKNDTAKGKVILNKTDEETGKPVKGVEFELRDKKGKVLETLKTDAAGHAESGLYEIASYEGGVYGEAIPYYLVETKTMDGYQLDEKENEIFFAYAGQATPIIEVKLEITNKPVTPDNPGTPYTPSNAPKTGDDTPVFLFVVLMAGAVGVLIVIWCRKRKRA